MKAGKYVKQLTGDLSYKAFVPNRLTNKLPFEINSHILKKLSEADLMIGRLDGLVELLPDPDFFLLMYIKREAASSAQIEGTRATFSDLLLHEAKIEDKTIPDDVKEITNYVDAMNYGVKRLKSLPLSLRLIKELHKILLTDTRGTSKNPGEFRSSQNWIGGRTIKLASYIPPPPTEMKELLDNFEKYLHKKTDIPILLKIALIHAQFEMIHPFLDGNGRIGRLLITFYMYHENVLRKPLLYLSNYFKIYRQEYYDRLHGISSEGKYEEWLLYFLDGILTVSENAINKTEKIIELRDKDTGKIMSLGKAAKSGMKLLDYLYSNPVVTGNLVEEITGLSASNARNLIYRFEELKILKQMGKAKRNKRFQYKRYLEFFSDE
ncbi:MAG: Fic family protein [Elusimicrobiota bacterium]